LCTLAVYPYSKEVTELQFVAAGDLQDKLERLPVLEEAVLPLSGCGVRSSMRRSIFTPTRICAKRG